MGVAGGANEEAASWYNPSLLVHSQGEAHPGRLTRPRSAPCCVPRCACGSAICKCSTPVCPHFGRRIGISPDSFEPWDYTLRQMLQWAFEPADETIVAAMIDKGVLLL